MPITAQSDSFLDAIVSALAQDDSAVLTEQLLNRTAMELANLLESLPPPARNSVWAVLPDEVRGEVLVELHDAVRQGLLDTMAPQAVLAVAQELAVDDLAYIIENVPDAIQDDLLDSLDQQDRDRLAQTLSYPDDCAGRLLDAEIVTVRPEVTIEVVLRYLRRRKNLPPSTDLLMVTDRDNTFLGTLSLSTVVTASPDMQVASLMDKSANRVLVTTPKHDVASLFERHALISVAVIDEQDRLLGRITVDEALAVIHDEADHALMTMAGLDEKDDLFAPVLPSARRRAIWLGINLVTAFLAAWVIGLFAATLEQVVALAVLMPIVASMGGIAGSQSLTLVIRGLALDLIASSNTRWLALKELIIGLLNGLLWAVVVGTITILWFGDWWIGGIIAIAMLINHLAAAIAGVAIPLLLHRWHLDPALSGSVILTTVTDVVGFFCFLGLGTLILL